MNIQDLLLGIRQGLTGGDAGTLVLAVVFIAALVFVIALSYALTTAFSPRGRIDSLLDERAGTKDTGRWPTRIIILAVLIAAFIYGGSRMGDPAQCARCHDTVDYAATLESSAHESVECLECHGQPGVAGLVLETATYARWISVYASTQSDPEPRPGSVSASQCLQCHEGISEGTVERYGVRVRHSDFLDRYAVCRDCHSDISHTGAAAESTGPTMNKCVICHDGTTAPADCDYCHVEDPSVVGADTRELPKVKEVDTDDCYACHDQAPCLSCHGVTMPHPENWMPGKGGTMDYRTFHARDGFAQREVCWRCHYKAGEPGVPADESCSCHGLNGKMHGGEAWIAEHGLQATGQKTGQYATCGDCHPTELCSYCHPSGYEERYNPKPGPDNYQRDIPFDPDYWEY